MFIGIRTKTEQKQNGIETESEQKRSKNGTESELNRNWNQKNIGIRTKSKRNQN